MGGAAEGLKMSGASFHHLKALVVEDNIHMRTLLRSLLNALGIKAVFESPDGTGAFNEIRERRPDFVLSDLSMKPMDGIEFTRRVRNDTDSPNPYVPIIMVTGHTERHRIVTARDAGVTEVLAKPITAQSLYARIAEIIERPRAFVRCDAYFGPDRRRRRLDDYTGPWRRSDDLSDEVTLR
ncbi:MAG TPA: response regulator [Rhizomicrobium sp.]|nr:response regulator [Rhizomicrobium sp.]